MKKNRLVHPADIIKEQSSILKTLLQQMKIQEVSPEKEKKNIMQMKSKQMIKPERQKEESKPISHSINVQTEFNKIVCFECLRSSDIKPLEHRLMPNKKFCSKKCIQSHFQFVFRKCDICNKLKQIDSILFHEGTILCSKQCYEEYIDNIEELDIDLNLEL